MIPVMDFQLLPDMGRMNREWHNEKNALFAAQRAAADLGAIATMLQTCKMNDVDPTPGRY